MRKPKIRNVTLMSETPTSLLLVGDCKIFNWKINKGEKENDYITIDYKNIQ